MYLTRFEINPKRRAARALLASPQKVHAAVLCAFPDADPADAATKGRVLWRLDPAAHDAVLYVVSPEKPDLTHLVESVGRPTYGWQTRDYTPFLDRLDAGDRWSFRLLANPVHNMRTDPNAAGRGRRVGHVTADQQTAWFLRQAERHGFSVVDGSAGAPDLVVRSRRTLRFERKGSDVTIATAVFEGNLQVVDADQLRSALVGGIGPAKGYGCGLLTLAAAGSP